MATTATAPDVSVAQTSSASTATGHEAGAVLAWSALLVLVLARGYRAVLLTLVVVALIPTVSAWSSYVLRTGSMEPSISTGDVVLAEPFAAGTRVPVGRVMIFTPPFATPGHETLVHRVVESLGDDTYVTAGDANRSTDVDPVPAANFRERPVICVPFVGLPLLWMSNRALLPVGVWLLLTMAAFYLAAPRAARRRRRDGPRAGRSLARAVRRGAAVTAVVAAAVVAYVAGVPPGMAGAVLTANTVNPGSTWQVSKTLASGLELVSPGTTVRGTVPLTATLNDTSGLSYSVRVDYAPAGTTTWRTLCTRSAAPYTCDWATTNLANQDYDLRAVATSGSTTITSAVVQDVLVDNAAPTVTMQDPGTPLRGTVTLAATASDALSGVSRVAFQYALSGTTTYKEICAIVELPWSCRFDTTTLTDGSYSFRAVATDGAGNTNVSAVVLNRTIDNTVSSVSLEDPGAFLTGTLQLSANASSTAGVTSVRIQRTPAGSTTWTDVCTDTTSPYGCSWNTTTITDGAYDLRAILTDGTGRTTVSATVANRRVDNSPLRAYDVQTANGGSSAGRLDTGDLIGVAYIEQANLSTITPGWNGSALAVSLRLRDGGLLGLGGTSDTLDILRSGNGVNLGSVNLRQDYMKNNRSAQFAATMTASTIYVNGVAATQVTIRLGNQTSGSSVQTVGYASAMVWTPSTVVTDLTGRAVSPNPVSELGAADREF